VTPLPPLYVQDGTGSNTGWALPLDWVPNAPTVAEGSSKTAPAADGRPSALGALEPVNRPVVDKGAVDAPQPFALLLRD
jgi:hypothetical protein